MFFRYIYVSCLLLLFCILIIIFNGFRVGSGLVYRCVRMWLLVRTLEVLSCFPPECSCCFSVGDMTLSEYRINVSHLWMTLYMAICCEVSSYEYLDVGELILFPGWIHKFLVAIVFIWSDYFKNYWDSYFIIWVIP